MEEAPKTIPAYQTTQPTPKTRKKQKDQSIDPSTCKKKRAQKTPSVYTLTNEDMEKIGYQLRDSMEEVLEETTMKLEELQMKVWDQCLMLQ